MENASKALLIAGGILLVMLNNRITSFFMVKVFRFLQ